MKTNNTSMKFVTTATVRTVAATCELNREAVEETAERLRSWALIRGASISGAAFVRLGVGGNAEVHLPTAGRVAPHPDTGLRIDIVAGRTLATIPTIPFEHVPDTLGEFAKNSPVPTCGLRCEFWPVGRSFAFGTFAVPRMMLQGTEVPPRGRAERRLAAGRQVVGAQS